MKPRLLDLFCGAGGAAMGYHRAGFEVVGVDHIDQPNYPFTFWLGDALEPEWDMEAFDVIHASPPCQHYANVTRWRGEQTEHPALIALTRDLLEEMGLPYVIENVRTNVLRGDFLICGTALGLPFRRHRHFETNWSGMVMNNGCHHRPTDFSFDHGAKQTESIYRDAMGCEWMTVKESREAIPPAYTEFIGAQLLTYLKAEAA